MPIPIHDPFQEYLPLDEPSDNFVVGLVTATNPANGTVQVQLPQYQNITSGWLHVVYPKTLQDKVYWMPDINEQVICMMDTYFETGVVLGAVYSIPDVTPVNDQDVMQVTFKDGTSFSYNRVTHAFQMNLCSGGSAVIQDSNGYKIQLDSNGNIVLKGLTITLENQNSTGTLVCDTSGNWVLQGVDLTANGSVLNVGAPINMTAGSSGSMQSAQSLTMAVPSGDKLNMGGAGSTPLVLATILTWLFAHTHNGVNGVTSAPLNPPTTASVETQILMGT